MLYFLLGTVFGAFLLAVLAFKFGKQDAPPKKETCWKTQALIGNPPPVNLSGMVFPEVKETWYWSDLGKRAISEPNGSRE